MTKHPPAGHHVKIAPVPEDRKLIQEQVRFFTETMALKTIDADGIYATFHVRKENRLFHFEMCENFLIGDFGNVLIEIAVDMKKQSIMAQVGKAKA